MESKRAFTLIELLVVIAIISVLAAILFPVFATAREKARQTQCLSNLKQIANSELLYMQDNDGGIHSVIPGGWEGKAGQVGEPSMWMGVLQPYAKNTQIFRCPSAVAPTIDITYAGRVNTSVGMNSYLGWYFNYWHFYMWDKTTPNPRPVYESTIQYPAQTVLFCDGVDKPKNGAAARGYYIDPSCGKDLQYGLSTRHSDGTVMVMADGHAKWVKTVSALNQMALDTSANTYVEMTNYNAAGLIWDVDALNPYTQPGKYPSSCCR